MATGAVWRLSLSLTSEEQTFTVPKHYDILNVAWHKGGVSLWLHIIDVEEDRADISFRIVGTGQPLDADEFALAGYCGTALQDGGEFVWHVFCTNVKG